jgi:hypothetical protein
MFSLRGLLFTLAILAGTTAVAPISVSTQGRG